jgi:AcrR family transcriptional regulator
MAQAGRRPGQNETKGAILDAARHRFASQGYDGATVRAIAGDAGVNAALLNHFFGSKQQLFVASMDLPINLGEIVPLILEGLHEEIGGRLVRMFLGIWSDPATRAPFLALLRSATTNDQFAAMLRRFMEKAVFAEVAEAKGIPRVRVAAAAAQMMGVALLRYVVGIPPLADATDEELVDLLAPVLQHYFDG